MKNALKIVAVLTLFISIGLESDAQVKRGDFFFEKFEYGQALEAYQFAYKEQHVQNPYILRKIALTHRMLGNMNESYEWYKRTIHRDQSNYLDFLYYAEALKYKKKYKEAKKFYNKYNKKVPGDRRAILHLENLNYVEELHRDSIYYSVTPLGMNTDKPEFGLTKYEDGYLYSAVGVVNPELGEGIYSKDEVQVMYLDVYHASIDGDGELHVGKPMNSEINSKYHDGPVHYDAVNKELIITRSNVHKDKPVLDSKGNVNLKLYSSKRVNGEFTAPVELPFNSDEISNAHPTVSPDGSTLYFASNVDGGLGESDIWFCKRLGDGWGHPQNIGTVINTEGDETWPYCSADGWLYFSSTGHAGLGGCDIFRTRFDNDLWTKPENVGAPINSHKDDFGIVTENDGKSGYFSSNRQSESVDDDIYKFSYDPHITIRAKIQDENSLAGIAGAIARIYDLDGNLLFEQSADPDGAFDFKIEPKKCDYLVEVSNGKEYSMETMEVKHCDKRLKLYDLGTIQLGEMRYIARGLIRDTVTDQPIRNFVCTLYNAESGDKLNMKLTKNDGYVKFSLQPETDYKLTLSKQGWFAKSAQFSTKGMDPGTIEIEQYVNLAFEQIVLNKPVEVDNIYYDLDKFFIRDDAKPELDKLVKMMTDNPTVVIELSSHTDSQGSDKYNLALSDKRAKSAAEYIVSQGVELQRITGKGYGEKKIKNKCVNGVSCDDMKHGENRRTEFKVLKF